MSFSIRFYQREKRSLFVKQSVALVHSSSLLPIRTCYHLANEMSVKLDQRRFSLFLKPAGPPGPTYPNF